MRLHRPGMTRAIAMKAKSLTPSRSHRPAAAPSGVNSQRSGLRSSSGVSSRQSRPRTRDGAALDADQLDDRGADRVRPHRRAQRKCTARRFVVLRALQHQIAARLMQPVDHLEIGVEIDPLQRRHPGLENLQPADRAVVTPLPRRRQARGPGGADTADEDKPGIARRGHIDGEFAFADFILSNHRRLAVKPGFHYPSQHLPASISKSPPTKAGRRADLSRRAAASAANGSVLMTSLANTRGAMAGPRSEK